MRGLFVTGTDTGVGKTTVAAGVALALRLVGVDVGVMKPVETGCRRVEGGLVAADAELLAEMAGVLDADALVCPARYTLPLAPAVAARVERRPLNLPALDAAYTELRARHGFLLVEGAGGLAVPLNDDLLMADLAARCDLPLLIVARAGLGTLNHTLLTAEFARSRRLEVFGIVLNRYPRRPDAAERTNPTELRRMTGLPVWAAGECPAPIRAHLPELQAVVRIGGLAQAVEASARSGGQ